MGRARALAVQLEGQLVDVAPVPVLSRLIGLQHWVVRLVKVGGRMFAGRAVTTADVRALGAPAQVHPVPMSGKAFDAAVAARLSGQDAPQMSTSRRHVILPRWRVCDAKQFQSIVSSMSSTPKTVPS
jgi:hypothetical protein